MTKLCVLCFCQKQGRALWHWSMQFSLLSSMHQSHWRRFLWHFSLYNMFCFLVFQDRVSLCSPGCPGTHSVDQAGLELRNPPASACRVLGLKACATTPGLICFIISQYHPHIQHVLVKSASCSFPCSAPFSLTPHFLPSHVYFCIFTYWKNKYCFNNYTPKTINRFNETIKTLLDKFCLQAQKSLNQ